MSLLPFCARARWRGILGGAVQHFYAFLDLSYTNLPEMPRPHLERCRHPFAVPEVTSFRDCPGHFRLRLSRGFAEDQQTIVGVNAWQELLELPKIAGPAYLQDNEESTWPSRTPHHPKLLPTVLIKFF